VRVVQRALTDEILAPLDDAERRQLLELLTRLKEGPIHGSGMAACWDLKEGHPPTEE
jgi:hypothetical protein